MPITISNGGCEIPFPGGVPQGVEVVRNPFDCGVGYGRNSIIGRVKTPFVLYLDDDYVVTKETDVGKFESILESGVVDIIGGGLTGKALKWKTICFEREGSVLYKRSWHYKSSSDKIMFCDMVANFWCGKTEKVNRVKWNSRLKINGEHTDFFLRASKVLKIGYFDDVKIRHIGTRNREYEMYRFRFEAGRRAFLRESGLTDYRWKT
jgi:hypothetical protein